MVSSDGQVLACAYGHCIGSVEGPDPVTDAFIGAFRNTAYAFDFLGVFWDSDCRSGGGAGNPGCDYGESYDQWAADQGVDTAGDAYQVPGALAAVFGGSVFGAKPKTKSGKPTYGDRGARSRAGTLTGKTTTKTHWAKVEVDRDGQMVLTYMVRSGSMTSGESQSSSHTEARVVRMSGTNSMDINGDPYSNLAPISPGDTVTIHGANPPASPVRAGWGRRHRKWE